MVSPELSSRGPNGAYGILKAQFRQIVGCTAARANADLKLRRKHYIRSTRAAAIQASRQHHRNTTVPVNDSKMSSADATTSSQYHEFFQFCHSYKDFHNPSFHPHYSYD